MNYQHIKINNYILLTAICFVVYMILSIGRVLPFDSEDFTKTLLGGAIFLFLLYFSIDLKIDKRTFIFVSRFVLVGLVVVGLGSIGSINIGYALDKFNGGILAPAAVVLLFSYSYKKFGDINTISIFIRVALAMLVITVVYKYYFGFFVRSTRFFLNGAIVFGWMSGLFCIISIYMYKIQRKKNYLIISSLFAVAVIWTQSKGPLLGLLVTSIYAFMPTSNRQKYKFLIGFGLFIAIFILNFEVIKDLFSSSRFSAIFRLLSGEFRNSDDGSIGLRSELFDTAINNVRGAPIFGIGLAEFSLFNFKYPHNQHLEIAAELGLPAFLLHLLFVLICFLCASPLYKGCILFFVISGSFSGDISYLRFLYSFCLIGFIFRSNNTAGVMSSKGEARKL